ncbi:MAG TPA: SRPBCC family protein [Polyangiaceae bacterium]|jgi:uncharacterized protein YndB with AHSA1/START domain
MKRKNETKFERTSPRVLVMVRTFGARASVVFDAWTKPELLKRWWAPCKMGVKLFECDVDLRVGGAWRYVFGREGEPTVAFSGVYKEVVRPTRLVHTQVFEPMRQAGDAIVTATFDEKDGQTTLTLQQLYPSKEALDGAIASGMEHGARETMEQLEELVSGGS